jgi:hypothetical protein
MAKRVSLDVVHNVVRADPLKSGPRQPTYLVRRGEVYFFQIRPPKNLLVPCLGIPPLRVRLGIRPRRIAQQRAFWLAGIARQIFEKAAMSDIDEHLGSYGGLGFDPGDTPQEFMRSMRAYLDEANAALDRPIAPAGPSQLRGRALVQEIARVQREVAKGQDGNPMVVDYAELLIREAGRRWKAGEGIVERPGDAITRIDSSRTLELARESDPTSLHRRASAGAAPAAVAAMKPAEVLVSSRHITANQSSLAPLFSTAMHDYLTLRESGGAARAVIGTAKLRATLFITVLGDRPIDCYMPNDLQTFVNDLCHLPVQFGKDGPHHAEIREMGAVKAISVNRTESRWEPLARKTIEDGHLQVVKAIINQAVQNYSIRHPLPAVRINWPRTAKASVKREALDAATLGEVFRLGIASGYLDDAILPPLVATTSRRIGLVAFIRGSDFQQKHGVAIIRIDGIGYDSKKDKWYRVPYKTAESLNYFVLHELWTKIGFVQWAKEQGDAFVFRLLHQCVDPADVASKRISRLLGRAGAIGKNIEVGHSLRHGAKNHMVDHSVDGETRRQQMGQSVGGDAHAGYGRAPELTKAKCLALSRLPLPEGVNWTQFYGLDFEAMAARPRAAGRRRKEVS